MLGTFGGEFGGAADVSANGRVVVGHASDAQDVYWAFRWVETYGLQNLGSLGGQGSHARAVSADGRVVVGDAKDAQGRDRAFRWTPSTGMQDLGALPGASTSEARLVSGDGRVIYGYSGNRIFRWTPETGMQAISEADTPWYIFATNYDGSVLVGRQRGEEYDIPVYWTPDNGMQDLNDVYAHLLSSEDRFLFGQGVSSNGRFIVGMGIKDGQPAAFLLDTQCVLPSDINQDGVVDDAALLEVLFQFGQGCPPGGAEIRWLGILPNYQRSRANAVSHDGRVVVGYCISTNSDPRALIAFKWTETTGMMPLAGLEQTGYRYSSAKAVSADGSVIAGVLAQAPGSVAGYRWTENSLTLLPYGTYADYISADGETIAGTTADFRVFRWTRTGGYQILTSMTSWVSGLSLDGNTIIGSYQYAPNGYSYRIYRWTTAEGFHVPNQFLNYEHQVSYCLSGDGQTIFGAVLSPLSMRGVFRWRGNETVRVYLSEPVSTNYRGDIAVAHTIVWSEVDGYWDITQLYPHLFPNGASVDKMLYISPNGRFIVGSGYRTPNGPEEAFLIRIGCELYADVNRDGVVDDADLLQVLFDFGRSCPR